MRRENPCSVSLLCSHPDVLEATALDKFRVRLSVENSPGLRDASGVCDFLGPRNSARCSIVSRILNETSLSPGRPALHGPN